MLNSLTTFVATVAISHVNNGERGASYAISVTTFESIGIVDDILKVRAYFDGNQFSYYHFCEGSERS